MEVQELNQKLEELNHNGFTVLEDVIDADALVSMQQAFDQLSANYEANFDPARINENEMGTLRCIISLDQAFHHLFKVDRVVALAQAYMGNFNYYSFNGFYTSKKFTHPTTLFHRDIKAFTTESVLSLNLLYNLDNTTAQNGATWIVPGSHKLKTKPSEAYIEKHKQQVCVQAGSVIVFNSLTYHASGMNHSGENRRAIANVLRLPFMKPQFDWAEVFPEDTKKEMSEEVQKLFGFNTRPAKSLEAYYKEGVRRREERKAKNIQTRYGIALE